MITITEQEYNKVCIGFTSNLVILQRKIDQLLECEKQLKERNEDLELRLAACLKTQQETEHKLKNSELKYDTCFKRCLSLEALVEQLKNRNL